MIDEKIEGGSFEEDEEEKEEEKNEDEGEFENHERVDAQVRKADNELRVLSLVD